MQSRAHLDDICGGGLSMRVLRVASGGAFSVASAEPKGS
jgi:hypothetical protein